MQQEHLKELVVSFLREEQAHVSFENAVKDLPLKYLGIKPENLPYSIWQLAEHIRVTQWDIVEFSLNPKHVSPNWPDDFWPKDIKPENSNMWKHTLHEVEKERQRLIHHIKDPLTDMLKPFAHGDGQNLLREAVLVVDHTAYHVGEIVVIRRLLGVW